MTYLVFQLGDHCFASLECIHLGLLQSALCLLDGDLKGLVHLLDMHGVILLSSQLLCHASGLNKDRQTLGHL